MLKLWHNVISTGMTRKRCSSDPSSLLRVPLHRLRRLFIVLLVSHDGAIVLVETSGTFFSRIFHRWVIHRWVTSKTITEPSHGTVSHWESWSELDLVAKAKFMTEHFWRTPLCLTAFLHECLIWDRTWLAFLINCCVSL